IADALLSFFLKLSRLAAEVRRRMYGIATWLPKCTGMRDHVCFVVHAPGGIFLGNRQLASRSWRPLRARLVRNLLKSSNLRSDSTILASTSLCRSSTHA